MTEPELRLLQVGITGWASRDFPGWISFTLRDVCDQLHHFSDKAPVLPNEPPSAFPCVATVLCQVVQRAVREGQAVAEVDTTPWGIATVEDQHRFWVLETQLTNR